MNADTRAKRSADVMWSTDNASKWFGAELVEIAEGRAVMTLTVESHHCNGHKICHGGVTFALADSAFAYACNSRNQITVAQANSITFIAPGYEGDVLTAIASEVSISGRSGIYDVTVKNQNSVTIGEFRGLSRTIKGKLFDEEA